MNHDYLLLLYLDEFLHFWCPLMHMNMISYFEG